uniref:Group 2 allergen Aca s 2 n=1 Tax=Acarus siro TaxID=66546 RepID=A7XZG9_ACASI|nr:group 2 allergen Aca s 2 [Acarus siro]
MKFVILAALIAVAAAELKFKDCGHHEVTKVVVNDCDGAYCVLHKSKPVNFAATFVANQDSAKLHLEVLGSLNGLTIPVPGVPSDGCKVVKCPLVKGQTYTAKYSMNIPSIIPVTKSVVTVKLTGDHGVVACGSVDGEIAA